MYSKEMMKEKELVFSLQRADGAGSRYEGEGIRSGVANDEFDGSRPLLR